VPASVESRIERYSTDLIDVREQESFTELAAKGAIIQNLTDAGVPPSILWERQFTDISAFSCTNGGTDRRSDRLAKALYIGAVFGLYHDSRQGLGT
jgi:hypothetical protein